MRHNTQIRVSLNGFVFYIYVQSERRIQQTYQFPGKQVASRHYFPSLSSISGTVHHSAKPFPDTRKQNECEPLLVL